ncbi:polyadenylate-binding protein-interacting protein 2B [Diabrotica virgifera virgifera]|uniref:Polyadenylate-binding protein-interacting protein 2B n=1 Tax=Diabrotica virgifera virgifera TaxID=50390 RepID=A0ABM5JHF9_DIAVI|nr:polyadenylate-binding protein-interacting protein 2B [Diabrotica virgifera virgifera]
MPGNQKADNGHYEYEENSYFTEGIENNVVEDFNTAPENDFSEYMWMEHEEEFDKEVMQRLEEEALMEECLQAFMNDENNLANTQLQDVNSAQSQQSVPAPESIANSKLNPEAAEFVPSSRRATQVPTSSS